MSITPVHSTRVKICCISSLAEADLAVRYGANALGLVSSMPSGPGVIDEALIAQIAARTPPGVSSFLLTSLQDTTSIIDQHRRLRPNTLQLVDRLEQGSYDDLREALPGIRIVQVIHVLGEASLDEAKEFAPQVDALLLDSGNPNLAVKELGGTGRTHNWEISREIVRSVTTPVFLAGGLGPENVARAIAQIRPYGVDLCSGVRTRGQLDEAKLARFMEAVRSSQLVLPT